MVVWEGCGLCRWVVLLIFWKFDCIVGLGEGWIGLEWVGSCFMCLVL